MAPVRVGFRLFVSAAAFLAFVATIAAQSQDPFQQAQSPSGNSDGNAAGNSANDTTPTTKSSTKAKTEPEFVWKSDAEWRKILTRDQYAVTRLKGTEPAYSGKYSHGHFRGTFLCVCCGAELFDAETKFESGTGWPSFWQPINAKAVTYAVDNSGFEVRTEVNCRRCEAHLGHVFDDGPPPTGHRYCMNSIALKLRPLGGASATNVAPSRSRSKAKAKVKAKTVQKSKAKSTTQAKKSPQSSAPSDAPTSDQKPSDQADRSPSAGPDRS